MDPDTLLPDTILDNTINPGSIFYMRNKLTGFSLSGLDIRGNSSPSAINHGGVVDIRGGAGTLLLQDLVVYDANSSEYAIRVISHNGTVTLKNIDSSGNPGGGAFINNSVGTAGITVTGSSFDENVLYPGLEITSNGAVVLTGVSASRNLGASSGALGPPGQLGDDHQRRIQRQHRCGRPDHHGSHREHHPDQRLRRRQPGGMTLTTKGNITLKDVSASLNMNTALTWIPAMARPAAGRHGQGNHHGRHF